MKNYGFYEIVLNIVMVLCVHFYGDKRFFFHQLLFIIAKMTLAFSKFTVKMYGQLSL